MLKVGAYLELDSQPPLPWETQIIVIEQQMKRAVSILLWPEDVVIGLAKLVAIGLLKSVTEAFHVVDGWEDDPASAQVLEFGELVAQPPQLPPDRRHALKTRGCDTACL